MMYHTDWCDYFQKSCGPYSKILRPSWISRNKGVRARFFFGSVTFMIGWGYIYPHAKFHNFFQMWTIVTNSLSANKKKIQDGRMAAILNFFENVLYLGNYSADHFHIGYSIRTLYRAHVRIFRLKKNPKWPPYDDFSFFTVYYIYTI